MSDLSRIADKVGRTGKIEAPDVLDVRRVVYADDAKISKEEAEAMFAIERHRTKPSLEWSALFVEAMSDHVLNQVAPAGYLSDDNAAWVVRQISASKLPSTDAHVELVTRLIENAREVPASFSAFALRLVKETVIYSDGRTADGRELGSGCVTDADLELLSRIVWGAGGEGQLAVSREEAEALFAISDATTGANNCEAFNDFFACAIGNYLLGATGRAVPSRDAALSWEMEAAYKVDVLAALSRVLAASPRALSPNFVADTLRNVRSLSEDVDFRYEAENRAREAAAAVASIMTPEKAGWLLENIDKNGVMSPSEKALVRFVARESAALDASLRGAVEKAD